MLVVEKGDAHVARSQKTILRGQAAKAKTRKIKFMRRSIYTGRLRLRVSHNQHINAEHKNDNVQAGKSTRNIDGQNALHAGSPS